MNLKSGAHLVGMSVLPQGMAPINDDNDDVEDLEGDEGEDEPSSSSAEHATTAQPCLLLLTKKVGSSMSAKVPNAHAHNTR
jgi:hypothetical protein